MTYKPDIADQRESPVRPLARDLIDFGADVQYFDPYVTAWNIDSEHGAHDGDRILSPVPSLIEAVKGADVVVLLQPHKSINLDDVKSAAKVILDTRGKLSGDNVIRL